MKICGKKRIIVSAVITIVCLWITLGVVDFSRVYRFDRPIFCVVSSGTAADDGGSGTYIGLGYAFEIEGNFMPEDVLPGVTVYTARIFGISVLSGSRDSGGIP